MAKIHWPKVLVPITVFGGQKFFLYKNGAKKSRGWLGHLCGWHTASPLPGAWPSRPPSPPPRGRRWQGRTPPGRRCEEEKNKGVRSVARPGPARGPNSTNPQHSTSESDSAKKHISISRLKKELQQARIRPYKALKNWGRNKGHSDIVMWSSLARNPKHKIVCAKKK